MAVKCNNHCNCENCNPIKVESLTLDDGRRAERHIVTDENGNEVVEIFAEEKRPLKLEKRIVRELKQVVAKDGEVTHQEIHSLEPEIALQVRSRIGVADHANLFDGQYVSKQEIGQMIQDGVVACVSALMMNAEPVMQKSPEPIFKAQAIVEKNVEEKKKKDNLVVIGMGIVMVAQILFFAYYVYFM